MTVGTQLDEPPYSIHTGDVERDRDVVLALWRGSLGLEERLAAKYDWFYRRCPWGVPMLLLLRHDPSDEWVGVAAIGPRRMCWNGHPIRAGVLVDLAVAPRHRTLGPALMLQRAVIERAAAAYDLIYGFPNPKAVPVVRRVGYAKLADLVRHSRVLRHAAYLRRVVPGALARPMGWIVDTLDGAGIAWRVRGRSRSASEWVERVDARFDALWARAAIRVGLSSIRDSASLRWRFDASPVGRTEYLLLTGPDGEPEAWFACQSKAGILHVLDFAAAASDGPSEAHVAALLAAARRRGACSVSVQHSGAGGSLAGWKSARFVERARNPVYGIWSGNSVDRDGPIELTPADEDE